MVSYCDLVAFGYFFVVHDHLEVHVDLTAARSIKLRTMAEMIVSTLRVNILGPHLELWLRLFRCKIFSVVKCFQMQMISKKTFVFPVFVCNLKNAPENILHCVFGAT